MFQHLITVEKVSKEGKEIRNKSKIYSQWRVSLCAFLCLFACMVARVIHKREEKGTYSRCVLCNCTENRVPTDSGGM